MAQISFNLHITKIIAFALVVLIKKKKYEGAGGPNFACFSEDLHNFSSFGSPK